MSQESEKLIKQLQVERLDTYLFRGRTPKPSLPHVFGGQVMAQAMNAAARTVGPERILHSLHSLFLRAGNPDKPILFDVDPIRDGGSFTTRRVVAKQDGKAIYSCSLSFQTEEVGLQHQTPIPDDVIAPELLQPEDEYYKGIDPAVRGKIFDDVETFTAWDIRINQRININKPVVREPKRNLWLRLRGDVCDNRIMQQTLLAYCSDYGFLGVSMLPHANTLHSKRMHIASLDHAMWFHKPVDVSQWLLHVTESHWAGGGRGHVQGRFYNQQGELLATTAQECLIRIKE